MPTPSVDPNYQLNPGESPDAYSRRIQAYRDSGGAATTPSGGYVATDGSGNATTQPNFSIDTSGPISSSILGTSVSPNDVTSTHKTYSDYVNGLAQAQQYSPDYVAALQAKQAADAKASELQTNFYTGNNLPGDTLDYAQGATAKAMQLNSQQQLAANQAMDVQALLRSGNIAGATALVQGNAPQSVAPGSSLVTPTTGQEIYSGLGGYQAVQGIQTVNNLAQQHADAGILPTDSLTVATQKAAASPSFQAQYSMPFSLPAGGLGVYNKTTGQVQTLVSTEQAATGTADSASLVKAQGYVDNLTPALKTADANFTNLTNLMKRAGIDDQQTPIINQLTQKLGKTVGNGDIYAYQSSINNLRSEYASVLAAKGGGVVDDSVRAQANQFIPDSLNLAQLTKVEKQIQLEGQTALSQYQGQIDAIKARLGGGSGSTNVGSSWNNLLGG
jgi:hypothetical protein